MVISYDVTITLPTGQRVPVTVESERAPGELAAWLQAGTRFDVGGFLVQDS